MGSLLVGVLDAIRRITNRTIEGKITPFTQSYPYAKEVYQGVFSLLTIGKSFSSFCCSLFLSSG